MAGNINADLRGIKANDNSQIIIALGILAVIGVGAYAIYKFTKPISDAGNVVVKNVDRTLQIGLDNTEKVANIVGTAGDQVNKAVDNTGSIANNVLGGANDISKGGMTTAKSFLSWGLRTIKIGLPPYGNAEEYKNWWNGGN